MVTLSKIYTKTGDDGTTGLGNGERRKKYDPRIAAYGDVDEANAALGLAHLEASETLQNPIRHIQNDLFDVGADLAVPEDSKNRFEPLRIQQAQIDYLENQIDFFNQDLPPLKSFILPGGTRLASYLHLARTITRRAERSSLILADQEDINPLIIIYLNRLSDLLFVLSRYDNIKNATSKEGEAENEPLWKPGQNR